MRVYWKEITLKRPRNSSGNSPKGQPKRKLVYLNLNNMDFNPSWRQLDKEKNTAEDMEILDKDKDAVDDVDWNTLTEDNKN